MNIESLKYFSKIVEAKSISKVAKQSHISQSALSQLIQKMEEELGYELLKRSNKGVELTEMGKIVLKYAENILINFNKMIDAMKQMESHNAKIRINATGSLVTYSLPCVLYKIKKKFPSYRYELISSSVEDTIRDVLNDICDFGIIDKEPMVKNMHIHKIGKERIVLVSSTKYPIEDKISLDQLMKYQMIQCNSIYNTCEKLDKQLKLIGKSITNLNVIFEIDNIGAVKASILNGFGIAFVPYVSVKKQIYEKTMKIIEIEDIDLEYELYLISKKICQVSKSTRESIEYFEKIGKKSFC